MSMSPEQRELLAIAYLTGQATPEQRRMFEALIQTDIQLQETVREIETWLAPMNTLVPEQAPPPDLLDEIMAQIDTHEAASPRALPAPPARASSAGWKVATLAATAIAITSTALHFVPVAPQPADPPLVTAAPAEPVPTELVALMSDQSAPSIVVVVYDPVQRRIIAQSANTELPSDLVWQLWLIRDGVEAPQSLGLLTQRSQGGRVELILTEDLNPETDLLAISLEPMGGSPEPGPTGPVLFTGEVREL